MACGSQVAGRALSAGTQAVTPAQVHHICAPPAGQLVFRSLPHVRGGQGSCRRCMCMCGGQSCAHEWGGTHAGSRACMHRGCGCTEHARGQGVHIALWVCVCARARTFGTRQQKAITDLYSFLFRPLAGLPNIILNLLAYCLNKKWEGEP